MLGCVVRAAGRQVGKDLQKCEVVVGIGAAAQPIEDFNDANYVALPDQRRGHESLGLKGTLGVNAAEEILVFADIRNDERFARGCDLSGDSQAEEHTSE